MVLAVCFSLIEWLVLFVDLAILLYFINLFPSSCFLIEFENAGLIVTTGNSEHEADWAPAAFPAWVLEEFLLLNNPFLILIIFLYVYPQSFVLIHDGNMIKR